ncbi:twin-arginine translocase TatA/TatE family subunit [Haliangium ochraceum]|uniref:Sec-independent protein translocase protein TatA n=1 Tax=Haliangium ochraceum (strain DSM 14365 / JCM 11303 / SMP-2) TaxID=502025 RepID=D0LYX3_HALO1|nr:twin-arginine translocase TatA/TatE family subunit [Haliangium ochraceum]ACY14443.1 twin-arginine translocation protein, TatA/E family subunit [Haliangium ochraceum DSM 14365]
MPGLPEMLVILAIVLLIFGAGKLPAIGDALGRSIKNFRRATTPQDEIDVTKRDELDDNKRGELHEGRSDVADAEVVSTSRPAAKKVD